VGGEKDSCVRFKSDKLKGQISLDHQGKVHIFENGNNLKLMLCNLATLSNLRLSGNEFNELLFHLSQHHSLMLVTDNKVKPLNGKNVQRPEIRQFPIIPKMPQTLSNKLAHPPNVSHRHPLARQVVLLCDLAVVMAHELVDQRCDARVYLCCVGFL
jgi:hypothetical protein